MKMTVVPIKYLAKIVLITTLWLIILSGMISLYQQATKLKGERKNTLMISVKFNVNPTKSKEILLAVGVLNKLSMVGRRESIRLTWFRQCKQNIDIVQCRFFTDETTNVTEKSIYDQENDDHGDMLFMPIKGGVNFTKRLIWMFQWFNANYEFDFFLRIDDDYFVCMNRLLMELPHRQKEGLYWGYVHCRNNAVRVDEGWMILTKDIITEALSKYNTTLVCHPYGDQAVVLWLKESRLNVTWFYDNRRVVHTATSYDSKKYLIQDLCEKYLALHGTYEIQMLKYWISSRRDAYPLRVSDASAIRYEIPRIPRLTDVCKADMNFDMTVFYPEYQFKPKLCKDNPTWRVTNDKFIGREESGRMI